MIRWLCVCSLKAWCLFISICSCLDCVHRGLIEGLGGLCQSQPSKCEESRYLCVLIQAARSHGQPPRCQLRDWSAGLVGGQKLEKSPGRLPFRVSTCSQNESGWAERICVVFSLHTPSFFPVCLHTYYLSRSWEKSSQRSPFVLWEPVSHPKETCLKINSLDFDLCWGFPTSQRILSLKKY